MPGVLDLAAPILAEGEMLEGFLAGDDGFDAEKAAERATASSASNSWPSSTSLADRVGGAPPAPAAGVLAQSCKVVIDGATSRLVRRGVAPHPRQGSSTPCAGGRCGRLALRVSA
jgi:hypothetical protein